MMAFLPLLPLSMPALAPLPGSFPTLPAEAGPATEEPIAEAAQGGGPADAGHAQVDALIEVAWRCRHDDSRRALATARQALALAEQSGYARGRAWALLRLAVCEMIVGDPACAHEQRLAQCIVLMRELADVAGEADAINLQARVLAARGELVAAIALDRRCLALRREVGNAVGQAGSLNNLAISLQDQGRTEEALACLLDSLQLATGAGDQRGMAYAETGLGWLYVRLELASVAVGHFERAFTHVARTADRALECTALTGLARALSLQARHDDALSMLQHARALAQRTGNTSDMVQVQLALAVVEQGRGRHSAAEPHLHAALSVLRRSPDQTLQAQVQLHLAISLWSTGRSQAALARLDRVRAVAQLIGSPALLDQADWLAQEVGRA